MKYQYTVAVTFSNDMNLELSLGKLLGNYKKPYWDSSAEAMKAVEDYIEGFNNSYTSSSTSIKVVKYRIRSRQVTEWEDVLQGDVTDSEVKKVTVFIR